MVAPFNHFGFTPAQRVVVNAGVVAGRRNAPDPMVRGLVGQAENQRTANIDLADDAEYDLGGLPENNALFEAWRMSDQRPVVNRYRSVAKADVAFTAIARVSNVVTATVATGGNENIQTGQWLRVKFPDPVSAAQRLFEGYFMVTDTTPTTIVWSQTAADAAPAGPGALMFDCVVFAEASNPLVLHDSIISADNEEMLLGPIKQGTYRLTDGLNIAWFYSDGVSLQQNTTPGGSLSGAGALGAAAGFALLAGTTVTNTGASVISGDVGLSPGTSITGFPPGVVNGEIHNNDVAAAAAQESLTAAYIAFEAMTEDATLASAMGGTSPAPGVYKFVGGVASIATSTTLTLDAAGDPDAVWVFQIESTLTTVTDSIVLLADGAQAKNVYWIVGSSATLGTGAAQVFVGNILALTSISANGGSVEGRLLARNGAVTISQATTVSAPGSGEGNPFSDISSNVLTSLYVNDDGELVVRNGADSSTAIRVDWYPEDASGLDQDGRMCLYGKLGSLRLRNRLGFAVSDMALLRVR